MDTLPEFLSVRQVAAYLQVSDKTVHRMVKAGRLPAARVGGQWRFRLLALARLNRLLRRDKFIAPLRRPRSPRQVIAAFRSWADRLEAAAA